MLKLSLLSIISLSTISMLSCKPEPEAITKAVASSEITSPTPAHPLPAENSYTYSSHIVKKGSSVYATLKGAGLSSKEIYDLTKSAKKTHDLSSLRAGTHLNLTWMGDGETKTLEALSFKTSPATKIELNKEKDNNWVADSIELPVERKLKRFQGVITESLWLAASRANVPAQLIIELAEVFAWQVDFQREIRAGDSFVFSVEEKYVDGTLIGYSKIIAAEFKSSTENYQAVLFPRDSKHGKYFQPDGKSLRKMFLKSPIKFGRITSTFKKRRFHPVLKKYRPHNGVDYGAPRGTPVRSVGDGKVLFAKRKGGSGKMIKIRHNSVYQTAYLHLNGYAKGIRRGAKVSQGQVIGYVGSTGLATGPHLHFSFYERGRYVNPLGKKFPSASPVKKSKMSEFKLVANQALEQLYSHTAQAPTTKSTEI